MPRQLRKLRELQLSIETQLSTENQKKNEEGRDARLIAILEYVADVVGDYIRYLDDANQHAINRKQAQQVEVALTRERRPIPTPFGGFNLDPKIALFGLAWATILTQVMFVLAAGRIRTLARKATELSDPARLAVGVPAPFWVCPISHDLESTLGLDTGQRVRCHALSGALHSGWFAAGAWLVWECYRWDAFEKVRFHLGWLLQGLLFGALLLSAVMAASFILPSSVVPLRLSRRRFLQAAGVSAAGLAVGGLSVWLYRVVTHRVVRGERILVSELPGHEGLAVNPRTGVAHHPRICSGHLRKIWNEVASISKPGQYLHPGYEVGILMALARQSDDQQAELFLKRAAQASPLSLHIYDRLVRLYGRQQRYNDIDALLEQALTRAKRALEDGGDSSVQQAVKGLADRLQRVRGTSKSDEGSDVGE